MGLFFKDEVEKERQEMGALKFRNQRRNLKYKSHQTGKSVKSIDEKRKALAPGKRVSKSGKIFYEYRKNRTDLKDSDV